MHLRSAFLLAFVGAACTGFDPSGTSPLDGGTSEGGADAGADTSIGPDPGVDASDGSVGNDGGILPCGAPLPIPETFASPSGALSNVIADATHVYWLAGPKIERRDQAMTSAAEPVITGFDGGVVQSFVVATPWVVASVGGLGIHAVQAGGNPMSIASGSAPLAANSTTAFGVNGNQYLLRGPPSGPLGIFANVPGVNTLAANDTNLFALSPAEAGAGQVVHRIDPSQNVQVAFYAPPLNPVRLAVDGTEIFMADNDRGEVFKAGAAANASTLLTSGESQVTGIAVRMKQVYYASAGGIRRVDASGTGCKLELTSTPTTSFTVSATHVYFVSGSTIQRVPR